MPNENVEVAPQKYYDVVIRRALDGVERTFRMPAPWPNGPDDFWWTEGNGACDCNRGDFFERAGGNEDADEPCGDSRYLVMRFLLSDGRVLDGPDAENAKENADRPPSESR